MVLLRIMMAVISQLHVIVMNGRKEQCHLVYRHTAADWVQESQQRNLKVIID